MASSGYLNREREWAMRKNGIPCLLVVSAFLFTAPAAHAYIDPGTGSYIFQILIGSGMAAIAMVATYFRQLKAWWAGPKPDDQPKTTQPDDQKK